MNDKRRTTRKGRVVYNRKKHYFTLRSVVRILEKMSVSLSKDDIRSNPYIVNALFEIVRTGFYPVWLEAINGRQPESLESALYSQIEITLRDAWKEQTREVCVTIGEEMGIPQYAIDFVMGFYDSMWSIIWSLTDPFFK